MSWYVRSPHVSHNSLSRLSVFVSLDLYRKFILTCRTCALEPFVFLNATISDRRKPVKDKAQFGMPFYLSHECILMSIINPETI